MRHGALFNGIGGFQLAAHWMGWENVMSCEIDEFCNKVTKYHFPNCIQHGDIETTDFSIYRGRIDVLTGGFPCQPFSAAGKRKGTADDRHLWPEMLRAIREIRPGWIVGENVYGLINWSRGMVFEQVQIDLESAGYETFAVILPACAKNAPHKRDRIWIIAYAGKVFGQSFANNKKREGGECVKEGTAVRCESLSVNESWFIANPDSNGLERIGYANGNDTQRWEKQGRQVGELARNDWAVWPTQPAVCFRDDGLSAGMDVDTISKSAWRTESIKAAGNAIVPQVAYEIFKAIEQYENINL